MRTRPGKIWRPVEEVIVDDLVQASEDYGVRFLIGYCERCRSWSDILVEQRDGMRLCPACELVALRRRRRSER